jgi:CheY-like chemotaxis protein
MLRVLLVEDDYDTRLYYERLIRAWGHHLCSAWTAMGAMELLRTEAIDLVVLDLELQGLMSGVDVKRHVPDRIPVILVTGHEATFWMLRGGNPGHPLANIAVVLIKPIDPIKLQTELARFDRAKESRRS